MTTNGVAFGRRARVLRQSGLDSVNVSLDSLVPERVTRMTGRPVFKKAVGAIYQALEHNYDPVKVNCVIIRGFNDDEICNFVELTKLLVRFIEYMPFGGNQYIVDKMVPYFEMLSTVRENFPELHKIRGQPSDTAKVFQVADWPGTVGFISSMTANFCSGCNRLRLTAEGQLKPCLHNANEVDLVGHLREANLSVNDLAQFQTEWEEPFGFSDQLTGLIETLDGTVDAALGRKEASHGG